jgi:hypothetical protein
MSGLQERIQWFCISVAHQFIWWGSWRDNPVGEDLLPECPSRPTRDQETRLKVVYTNPLSLKGLHLVLELLITLTRFATL